MEDIIKKIEQADEIQLNDMIYAINRRYAELHTDREGGFISLSTGPHTRDKELEDITRFIRIHYNK